MDTADFESEDCGFDPRFGRLFLIHSSLEHIVTAQRRRMAKSWIIGIHGFVLF